VPDVVTTAKGLGGGIPVGAVVALGERAAGLLGPGQHGTTFGGNPVAAAAALATLHVIERDGLLANARAVGQRLRDGVLAIGSPLVTDVAGEGLLLGIRLARPAAAEVTAAALEAGFVVNAVAPDVVRLAPPLVLTPEQADAFLAAFPAVLAEVAGKAERGDTATPDRTEQP
jgi:acetylornithine aminotransferase